MKQVFTIYCLFFAICAQGQSITLATSPPLTGGTSTSANSGISMNVEAKNSVNILAFRAQVNAGVTGYEIWYKTDSLSAPPNVSTAGGWVMHETGITTAANPQTVPLITPLPIPSGSVYAICFRLLGVSIAYTSNPSPSMFSDANMRISVGNQAGYAGVLPNLTLHPRGFTGAIIYELSSTSLNDIGVTSIDSPAGGCEGMYNVVATVKNFGINQVDTFTVNWMLNGTPQTPVIAYTLLDTSNGLGSTSTQVVLGSVTFTGGSIDTIIVWTSDPNNAVDTVTDNDTVIKGYNSLPTIATFPYYQDFESGQANWVVAGTNSSWAFGTPAKTNIIGTASGVNAFVTGGLSTGVYNASENSQVKSPCFDMRNFEGTPWVALDVNWFSEPSWDGTALQSSVDGGTTWQNVGKFNDPNNWYNDNSLDARAGGSSEGWAGMGTASSGGWKRAKHVLPLSLVGSVVNFRLAFGADNLDQYDGFAFDNFTLVDFRKPNMGPDTTSFCGNPTVTLNPNIPLNGGLKWFDMDSLSLTKTVNAPGMYWVAYTDTMIDEIGNDTIELIQSPAPQIAFENLIDTISIDDQITLNPHTPYNIDYTWTPGGLNIPFLLVKASDFGVGTHLFNLHVIDSVRCEDSENITIVILDYTGIEEGEEEVLQLYPNPVYSNLILELRNAPEGSHPVTIMDMQGRILFSRTYSLAGNSRIELDFSGFAPGNYLIRIDSKAGTMVRQVVKN